MANDAIRMSTADLRRKLLTPAAPAAPSVDAPPAPPPARSAAPPQRFVMPASLAPEAPLAEEAEIPFEIPASLEYAIPASQPGLQQARTTPTELARPPVSRGSHQFQRPAMQQPAQDAMRQRYAEPAPAYDPINDQLRMDVDQLKRDNQNLQGLMDEMRQLLQDASEQEQRVQTELSDRESKLAFANARLQELETIVNTKPKTKSELEEWADELERESFQIAQERRTMEDDRRQLREDEETLERQMRDMEVQMARDRAILARQEQELKRLNAEIQHELELMQRGDGNLRDRLAVFQRRHAEAIGGPTAASATAAGASYSGFTLPPVATGGPTMSANPTPKKNDTTGLLRKIFRGGE